MENDRLNKPGPGFRRGSNLAVNFRPPPGFPFVRRWAATAETFGPFLPSPVAILGDWQVYRLLLPTALSLMAAERPSAEKYVAKMLIDLARRAMWVATPDWQHAFNCMIISSRCLPGRSTLAGDPGLEDGTPPVPDAFCPVPVPRGRPAGSPLQLPRHLVDRDPMALPGRSRLKIVRISPWNEVHSSVLTKQTEPESIL